MRLRPITNGMKALVNKKALFNYEPLEKFEAGLKLSGGEVKSIKGGRLSFEGSYITIVDGEVFWRNATIPPYQPKNTPPGYEPTRNRKLLLSKKEIAYIRGRLQQKGLTAVPLRVYNKRGNLKIEIALVRAKKKHDKREILKKRDMDRDAQRELKDKGL